MKVCHMCPGEIRLVRVCPRCGQHARRGRPRRPLGSRPVPQLHPRVPVNPERTAAIVISFQAGETLAVIGQRWGVTREWVRQILEPLISSEDRRAIRAARVAARRAARREARLKPYLEHAVPCAMCQTTVLRGQPWKYQYATCSPRCRQAFALARYYVAPEAREAQRLIQARSILRHAEKHGVIQIRHAERVLAGTARRVSHPKSRGAQVAREFGFEV